LFSDEGIWLELSGQHIIEYFEEEEYVLCWYVFLHILYFALDFAFFHNQVLETESKFDYFVIVDLVDEYNVEFKYAQHKFLNQSCGKLQ